MYKAEYVSTTLQQSLAFMIPGVGYLLGGLTGAAVGLVLLPLVLLGIDLCCTVIWMLPRPSAREVPAVHTGIEDQQCGYCRFWIDENGLLGFCHRLPPRIVDGRPQEFRRAADDRRAWAGFPGIFPVTQRFGWCGEFKMRDGN